MDSQIVYRILKILAARKEQGIEAQIIEVAKVICAIEKVDSEVAFSKVQKRIKKLMDGLDFK